MNDNKNFLDKITELGNLRLIVLVLSVGFYFFALIFEKNETIGQAFINTVIVAGRIILIGLMAYSLTILFFRGNRTIKIGEKVAVISTLVFLVIHAIALFYEYEFFSALKLLSIPIVAGLVLSAIIGLIFPKQK